MISIKGLEVNYGNQLALSVDDLHIGAGEKICLIGKSGSGKSTMLECIFGLREYEGEINRNIQNISLSLQKSDLIPNFTVKTNILMGRFGGRSFFRNLASICKHEPMVDEVLESLNIPEKKNQYVKNLSGGEQQRVLLARALYEEKAVYLLDEPTSALDVANSRNAIETLLSNKADCTVMCAIHNLSLISFFQRIIVMKGGKIVLDDAVANINVEDMGAYFDD
ncbi:MAG: ATP-binding cassette domain-containing protein [Defluviitaleaceae bacterium]|nr:ATP-binding cassette domain-containing protein [Defluviitaleaceae bacterium]MCL2235958.1 ATP-binding cassette domain-containing protein [Defluviitaleaceae bacterium]